MEKIIFDIVTGKDTVVLEFDRLLGGVLGYVGICGINGQNDVAITTSYPLAQMYLIPTNDGNIDNRDKIRNFLSGSTTFVLKLQEVNKYIGVVWPLGACNNPNLFIVDNITDATKFIFISGDIQNIDNIVLNDIFTGKRTVRFKTSENRFFNGKYAGVCGYGPCKTLSFGLLPEYSNSNFKIISTKLHKINCCIDVGSISKCASIPVYDCDDVMNEWCSSNKQMYDYLSRNNLPQLYPECGCLNSQHSIPQCFDMKCYNNDKAYLKNKTCDRKYIDCVKFYKEKKYDTEVQSMCGYYQNIRSEYLEKGEYIKEKDILGLVEDNYLSILSFILILTCIVYLS